MKIIALIFLVPWSSLSFADDFKELDNLVKLLRAADSSYCIGDRSKHKELVQLAGEKYPEYYEVEYLKVFGHLEQKKQLEPILAKSKATVDVLSHAERMNIVYAQIFSRSNDFGYMEMLLDFVSANESYEANRQYLLSYVFSLRQDWKKSNEHALSAIEKAPIITPAMIDIILGFDGSVPAQLEFAKKAASILEHKKEKVVAPKLAETAVEYVKLGADVDLRIRKEMFKPVFEDCPRDAVVAERYAYDLLSAGKDILADGILSKLIVGVEIRSPTAEALYAESRERVGDSKTAIEFYEIVVDPENLYVSNEIKSHARERLKTLEKTTISWQPILFFVLMVGVIAKIIVILLRKNSRK